MGETILNIHVELPVTCSECGISLPDEFFEQGKLPSRTCLCVECQQKLADLEKTRVVEPGYRKPKILPTAHCQQCGKDVSAEIGPIQHGDYVCELCRKNAQANPIDLMINLFQQNYQQTQSQLNIPDYLIEKKLGEGGHGCRVLGEA